MAKVERKYLAHFINGAKTGDQLPVYERLGKDLEDFTAKLAAKAEVRKNILGQTQVAISGYEKTANVEPFYADDGSVLFARLQEIIDGDLTQDMLKTDVVEVKLWEQAEGTAYPAIREEAFIEVRSYGGDAKGYRIGFALYFTGNKVKGRFDMTANVFTPEVS